MFGVIERSRKCIAIVTLRGANETALVTMSPSLTVGALVGVSEPEPKS